MQFLTDFADQAVILPLALVVGLLLLMQGWRRGAAAWLLAVGATFGTMLALKLVLHACYQSFGLLDLRTPSGHAAAAALISGGLGCLLSRRRAAALPLALLAAAVIGTSRLVLGAHTLPEVAVGTVVGVAGAVALPRLAGPPPPGLDVRRIALAAVLAAVLLHGLHAPAEAQIRSSAAFLARYFGVCATSG